MSNDDAVLRGWLRVARCPQIRPSDRQKLVDRVGDVAHFASPTAERLRRRGVQVELARELSSEALTRELERELRETERLGWRLLSKSCPGFPRLLADLSVPPPVIAVRGLDEAFETIGVGIVGSRHPSAYGRQMARRLAGDLASRTAVIVSGLAQGIDAIAHESALEVGGLTVAVLGTGPDRVYPTKHRALAARIVEQGALVTEFPPGTVAHRSNFPRRNRIIAGLSRAVVVVEGKRRSGSMITARWAADEAREVATVPGRVGDPLSEGPFALIRSGAALATDWRAIVRTLRHDEQKLLFGAPSEEKESETLLLDENESAILAALLPGEALELDALLESVTLDTDAVLGALFTLELSGLIERQPGQRFAKRD